MLQSSQIFPDDQVYLYTVSPMAHENVEKAFENDTSQQDDNCVSHDILPLEPRQAIMPPLVNFPANHHGNGKWPDKRAYEEPTGKTDTVSLVQSKQLL